MTKQDAQRIGEHCQAQVASDQFTPRLEAAYDVIANVPEYQNMTGVLIGLHGIKFASPTDMVIVSARTLDYRIGSALALPFEPNTFDVVACGELIEHFADPAPLVAELARVCKIGGRIIISTLDATCEAAKAHGDYPEHMIMWEKPEDLLPLFAPYGASRAWIVGHYFMVECGKGKV